MRTLIDVLLLRAKAAASCTHFKALRAGAVVKDGKWREIGERTVTGKEPVQFFEMNLKRVSDTDWPAAGAVKAK